jgi:N-acetylglucosamine-6-phosphate deacetylase
MPEGEYYLGTAERGQKIRVAEGVAWLAGAPVLAGGVVIGSQLVRNMVELAEVPLREAIQMMTVTPARILRVDHFLGSLDRGKMADLVVLGEDLSVLMTIVGGKIID